MINITINAETGAEARGALLELLGLNGGELIATVKGASMQFIAEREDAIVAPPETAPAEAAPAETTKKRRSKAEIEPEKTPVEKPTETFNDNVSDVGTRNGEVVDDSVVVTKEDLQKKAVELGRVGKKELCRAVLQKHGADSISTADKNPLKLELYATVLDEFNKL